ncbi:hypothetical protein [Paenibacillus abyssi]|uniref:Uncharacterized protein n=1 Tax=Paenibacillus abyssi TaxID=1340531 RepID=A0A917LF78_9BACL|nr:hypothetical protein [Paenibacillus abyssi]GGG18551.1 hypothetical protein GCM10010916_39210 [Paenibacillus abyssi]
MKMIAKFGNYFEKRQEVSFWVNALMFIAFVLSKQYIFAGVTLALAIVQFQPSLIMEKIPALWRIRMKELSLKIAYRLGRKSFLVSTSGVMRVVRLRVHNDLTWFICPAAGGRYMAAAAESNRFCKTPEASVQLLASLYQKELDELRGKLDQKPVKSRSRGKQSREL